jgi:hypothetical protein
VIDERMSEKKWWNNVEERKLRTRRKIFHHFTFLTTNPIWTDLGCYPSICGKSSKTERLSNGRGLEVMVTSVYKKLSLFVVFTKVRRWALFGVSVFQPPSLVRDINCTFNIEEPG